MQQSSLLDDRMMAQREAEEQKLRAAVAADASLTSARRAWDVIAKAEQRNREIHVPWVWLEGRRRVQQRSVLLCARSWCARPTSGRSRTPSGCASTPTARCRSCARRSRRRRPVYPELEQVKLSFSLERMREYLGPDHPIVKAVLGSEQPGRARAGAGRGSDARAIRPCA